MSRSATRWAVAVPGSDRPPPRDVRYGEKTTDEMGIGTLALLGLPY